MKSLVLAATVAVMGVGSAQAATTIGFQPLTLSTSVPVTYTESGYTIRSNNTREPAPGFVQNSTLTMQNYIGSTGTGIPAVNFARSTSFTLTGGTFKFEGLSAFFSTVNGASNSFTVTGSLFDKELYSTAFTAAGGTAQQIGGLRDYNSGSTLVFDKLVFTSGSMIGQIVLDDIKVTAAAVPTPDPVPVTSAVPEPATWAMMLVGFGAIGSSMRRRGTARRMVVAG